MHSLVFYINGRNILRQYCKCDKTWSQEIGPLTHNLDILLAQQGKSEALTEIRKVCPKLENSYDYVL